MGNLVFIPSYNDCRQAYRIYRQAITHPEVTRVLIVDDSDTQECREYYKTRQMEKLTLIQGTRHSKWAAWRTALEMANEYDAVIQLDADITINTLDPIIEALKTHDAVTAYVDYQEEENSWTAQRMTELYRRAHREAQKRGKPNMGGGVIGLTKKTAEKLRNLGFFTEPTAADDHVVALAASSLGYRLTTVDCGVKVRLPSNTWEWVLFRARHMGAAAWAREYVKNKLGENSHVEQVSRGDYRETAGIFVGHLIRSPPLTVLVFTLITLASLLPLGDRTKWRRLASTKPLLLCLFSLPL